MDLSDNDTFAKVTELLSIVLGLAVLIVPFFFLSIAPLSVLAATTPQTLGTLVIPQNYIVGGFLVTVGLIGYFYTSGRQGS